MASHRVPSVWQGVLWALARGAQGGGVSRARLAWRACVAAVAHGKAVRRWMGVVCELHARGIAADLKGEYLRAVRPFVNRHTGITERAIQLIDHNDWLETAFSRGAFERLASGRALVLAELPAPRGYEYMRLQLQRAPVHSPEGELLLTLTLLRAPEVQHKPLPVDAAVMALSRLRIDNVGCLVIGGVRGQRNQVLRMSPVEVSHALSGWKPSVLMVRVAQELARFWHLKLVGLDPDSHQLRSFTYQFNARHRDAAERIYASYDALWEHFDAAKGPDGWMIIPLDSDEKLEATALSPEKRARQTRRADYWIRIRKLLKTQMRDLLIRPGREARLSRVTESETVAAEEDGDPAEERQRDEEEFNSRVLQTGSMHLT